MCWLWETETIQRPCLSDHEEDSNSRSIRCARRNLQCEGTKSIRTMSAGSEFCAPFGVASSRAQQRKKILRCCAVRATKVARGN